MELRELGMEYAFSAKQCRERASELRRSLKTAEMSSSKRIALMRRIAMLEEMGRQASAIGRYLCNYYGRRCWVNERDTGERISGVEELFKETGTLGKRNGAPPRGSHSVRADVEAGSNSAYVLFGAEFCAQNSLDFRSISINGEQDPGGGAQET